MIGYNIWKTAKKVRFTPAEMIGAGFNHDSARLNMYFADVQFYYPQRALTVFSQNVFQPESFYFCLVIKN